MRALEAGADDYVTKPLGPNELVAAPTEFELLRSLMRNRGRLMTHRALLTDVWGAAYRLADDEPLGRPAITEPMRPDRD